jgi:hypothetical protein
VSVLVGLEGDLVRTLQSVKKGIAMLDERRAELMAADESVGPVETDESGLEWVSETEDEPETALR